MAPANDSNSSTIMQPEFCLSFLALDISKPHYLIFAIVFGLLSPISVALNSILLYALYKTGQLKTLSNKLIALMTSSDLCIGIIVLPALAVTIGMKKVSKNCLLDISVNYLATVFVIFSFLMLICISIDRYLHVTKLIRYNAYMNRFRMWTLIIMNFGIVNVVAIIGAIFHTFILQVIVTLINGPVIGFTIMIYVGMLKRLRNHQRRLQTRMSDNTMDTVKVTQNNDVEAEQNVSNVVRNQEDLAENSHMQTSSGNSIRTVNCGEKSGIDPHGSFVGVPDIGQQSRRRSTTPEQKTATGLGATAVNQHRGNSTTPNQLIKEQSGRPSVAPDVMAMTQCKGASAFPDYKIEVLSERFPAAANVTSADLYTIHASAPDCANIHPPSCGVIISPEAKKHSRTSDLTILPKARWYSIAQKSARRYIRGSKKGRNNLSLKSANEPLDQNFRDQEQARQHSNRQLSAVRSIKFLLITICITNGPFHVTSMFWTYYKYWLKVEPSYLLNYVQYCSLYLVILNSCLNSGLIIYGNTSCRRYIRSMFRRNQVTQLEELV